MPTNRLPEWFRMRLDTDQRKERFLANWAKVRPRFAGTDMDLAKKARVSQSAISQMSNGGSSVDRAGAVTKVCRVLGVDPDSMWEDEPKLVEPVIPTSTLDPLVGKAHTLLDELFDDGADPLVVIQLLDAMIRARH